MLEKAAKMNLSLRTRRNFTIDKKNKNNNKILYFKFSKKVIIFNARSLLLNKETANISGQPTVLLRMVGKSVFV